MWIWITPVVLSYLVFVFVAEHINPFKKFRETSYRRRIKSGRRAGLIALPLFFLIGFTAQFVLINGKDLKRGNTPEAILLTSSDSTVGAVPIDATSAINTTGPLNSADALITPSTAVTVTGDVAEQSIEKKPLALNENSTNASQLIEKIDQTNTISETGAYSDINAWINAQNPNSYTVQLYLSNDRGSVNLFLNQPQLPQPNAIFPFERNGLTWYALVHGAYTSFSQANTVLHNLPEQAQNHSQWIRQFNELQELVSQ